MKNQAAIIIQDDTGRRMVYLLREPISFEVSRADSPFNDLVPTTVSIRGELVEGREWSGELPLTESNDSGPGGTS